MPIFLFTAGCFTPKILRQLSSSGTSGTSQLGSSKWTGAKQLGNITVGAGAALADTSLALAVDSSGNTFVAGHTAGTLGETNGGLNDVYIAKWNDLGNLDWIRQLGATTMGAAASGDDTCYGIHVSASGDIYVGGSTTGSLGEANGGSRDVFVAKWNSAGVFQWVKQLGSVTMGASSAGLDFTFKLKGDSSNNLYVTGYTTGSFGEALSGADDAFAAKFDSSGTLQWVRQLGNITIGAAANLSDRAYDVSVDSSGNVTIVGDTASALGEASAGAQDIFLARWNSAGVFQWVKQLGNVTIGANAAGSDNGRYIIHDSSDNILISGQTSGSLAEAIGGPWDAYAAKFNSAGSMIWMKQLGSVTIGAGASATELGRGIGLNSLGDVIISGHTNGALGEPNGGTYDIFIARISGTGAFKSVSQFGLATLGAASSGTDYATGLVVDGSDKVIVTGTTSGAFGEANAGGNDAILYAQ